MRSRAQTVAAPSNGHLGTIGGALLDRHLIRGSLWSRFFPPHALHTQELLTQCCSACTSDVNNNHSLLENTADDLNQVTL